MQELTPEQQAELQEKLKNMSPEELQEFQKQQCIFCQILSGKVPSKKIYEDDKCLAILDINPAAKGHLLLLTKEHYSIMPQIPDGILGHLAIISKYLSQSLLKILKVGGTNIFIANGLAAGQKAQHFMVHIIPRKEGDGLLEIDEKLIEKEMQDKVRTSVESRLNELLGVEVETQTKLDDSEDLEELEDDTDGVEDDKEPEPKEEEFITSKTSKSYHLEGCKFVQKIKEENRQYLSEEMAKKLDKKPCTCITGKKIPLKEEAEPEPEEIEEKPIIKKEKKDVDLDDIANLFK